MRGGGGGTKTAPPAFGTYCGVVGGDVEQNLRGASAGYVSVAVPHARDQVGLASKGKRTDTQVRNATRAAAQPGSRPKRRLPVAPVIQRSTSCRGAAEQPANHLLQPSSRSQTGLSNQPIKKPF